MRKKIYFVLMLILSVIICHGSVVQWDEVSFGHWFGNIYYLNVRTPDDGVIVFDIKVDLTTLPETAILINNLGYSTLGYGILLLQTDYNMLIDYELFTSSSGKLFQAYSPSGGAVTEANVEISLDNTIILAFVAGDYDSYDGEFWNAYYGWMEFGYTEKDGVHIVNAAINTTWYEGLRAGVIPEPSCALLALSGVALLLRQRSRPVIERFEI